MANFYKSCIDLQNKFNPQFIMQAYEIFIFAPKHRILYRFFYIIIVAVLLLFRSN